MICTFLCLPSLGLRPNARSRACSFDWSSKPCSATEGDHSVSHPPCVAAPAKRPALCQCVNARLLDSRQDNDANNGLLFWVQFYCLIVVVLIKSSPVKEGERQSFPMNEPFPFTPCSSLTSVAKLSLQRTLCGVSIHGGFNEQAMRE